MTSTEAKDELDEWICAHHDVQSSTAANAMVLAPLAVLGCAGAAPHVLKLVLHQIFFMMKSDFWNPTGQIVLVGYTHHCCEPERVHLAGILYCVDVPYPPLRFESMKLTPSGLPSPLCRRDRTHMALGQAAA